MSWEEWVQIYERLFIEVGIIGLCILKLSISSEGFTVVFKFFCKLGLTIISLAQ